MGVHKGGCGGKQVRIPGEYPEVVLPEKLVSLFEFEGMAGHLSLETMTLTERNGRTIFTNTSTFEFDEDSDGMFETGMEEGLAEMTDRLARLVKDK